MSRVFERPALGKTGRSNGSSTGTFKRQTSADSLQRAAGNQAVSKALRAEEHEPVTLQEVVVTAERPKSAAEFLNRIGSLQAQLRNANDEQQAKAIAGAIKTLFRSLESAPIAPTPKRENVAGPFRFGEYGDYFYDFGFETMQDKHWKAGWKAIYELAAGPFGAVIALCDLLLGPEEQREEAVTEMVAEYAAGKIADKGTDAGRYLLRRGASKGLAKGVAATVKTLGRAIGPAIAAYEVYQANTKGPSPHDAAVETVALIMAAVYGTSDGRDGTIRIGGFIPTPTGSYCRVARQQDSPFPQLADRKLAFDLMANRLYERMKDLIALKHIATPEAFYAFRAARVANAWNLVEAAGDDLMGRKFQLIRGNEKQLARLSPWSFVNFHKEAIDVPFELSGGPRTGFNFYEEKSWKTFGQEVKRDPMTAAAKPGLTNNYSVFNVNDSITPENFVNLMLGRFVTGIGPENFVFPRDGKVSQTMAESAIVEDAIEQWYETNRDALRTGGAFQQVSGGHFGTLEQMETLFEQGGILNVPQFIGSASVTVTALPNRKELLVTIRNVTSATSGDIKKHFYLGTAPSFPKDTLNPHMQQYTNISQTFEVTVPIDWSRVD